VLPPKRTVCATHVVFGRYWQLLTLK